MVYLSYSLYEYMSFLVTYSPESLWRRTVRLLNGLFQEKPKLATTPQSYFVATLHIHNLILQDLSEVFEPPATDEEENTPTMEQIHASLVRVETVLLGTSKADAYPKTIRGCCDYTDHLTRALYSSKRHCVLL